MAGYIVLLALISMVLLSSCSTAADVTVNEVAMSARCIVHEVPDDERRADVLADIERIRDRFLSGREILDAAKLDDSALKSKLPGDFLLYTTIDSRLFRAATEPLNIQVDGGTLRWNGVSAPVGELRIILVGKNPYGKGYCVVYAAGSNRLLKGINGLFHGPCSYHIFNNNELLKEGYYTGDFAASNNRLSQAEALDDVNQFFSTLQRVHPDLLAKVDLEDYVKLKQQTADEIKAKLDNGDTVAVSDLAYLLYYAAAFFGDGHTSILWSRHTPAPETRYPCFALGYDNGRFVITASTDEKLKGMEVLAVDGKPVLEFLKPVLDRCSGETLAFKASRFSHNQRFWYGFSNLCGSVQSIAIKLRDADGNGSERKVETIDEAQFRELESEMHDTPLNRLRSQGTRVNFLDSDKVAHFIYPSFNLSDDEKKKIDGIFREIKEKEARDLIIDIRGNGGGNSSMGDYIFGYLYDGKFTAFSKSRIRLSEDVRATVAKGWNIPDSADVTGMVITRHSAEKSVPKPEAFYSGRVFLLVDNGSFSSASAFATMFRDYGVGKIIGYETGGIPNSFGDQYSFSLKNSGILCGVSWKQFFCPRPKPGDDEHGVIPDIPMTEALLRPYAGEEDPVLAFTLDYIRKGRN